MVEIEILAHAISFTYCSVINKLVCFSFERFEKKLNNLMFRSNMIKKTMKDIESFGQDLDDDSFEDVD
jgi:hypothetical protein